MTRRHIAFNKKARAGEEATSVHMGSDENREVAVSPDQISFLRVHLRKHTYKQTNPLPVSRPKLSFKENVHFLPSSHFTIHPLINLFFIY